MKLIDKIQLEVLPEQKILLPSNSKILSITNVPNKNKLLLWFEFETDVYSYNNKNINEEKTIYAFEPGDYIFSDVSFITTVYVNNKYYHIFKDKS